MLIVQLYLTEYAFPTHISGGLLALTLCDVVNIRMDFFESAINTHTSGSVFSGAPHGIYKRYNYMKDEIENPCENALVL